MKLGFWTGNTRLVSDRWGDERSAKTDRFLNFTYLSGGQFVTIQFFNQKGLGMAVQMLRQLADRLEHPNKPNMEV